MQEGVELSLVLSSTSEKILALEFVMLKLFYTQWVQNAAGSHFIYRQEATMFFSWTHSFFAVTWKQLISLHQTWTYVSKGKKTIYTEQKLFSYKQQNYKIISYSDAEMNPAK